MQRQRLTPKGEAELDVSWLWKAPKVLDGSLTGGTGSGAAIPYAFLCELDLE